MIIILAHYETGESDAVGIAGTMAEADTLIREWLESRDPDSDPCPTYFGLFSRGREGRWEQFHERNI
jgi:hypothetical protein